VETAIFTYFAAFFPFISIAGFLIVGFLAGRYAEKSHYDSIVSREKRLAAILAFSEKTPPPFDTPPVSALVVGSVVISSDYFKNFTAGLRNLFGGRMRSYESLLDRARREAILRMKQEADELGARYICNVRIETSPITQGGGNQIVCVEAYAYGTALVKRRR
jgi:uncharacterized protein YbjQ (UPF0145 family)